MRSRVIRMCDGKNRLKAEAGTVPFPEGKGERGRKPSRFFIAGEKSTCFRNHHSDQRLWLSSLLGDAFKITPNIPPKGDCFQAKTVRCWKCLLGWLGKPHPHHNPFCVFPPYSQHSTPLQKCDRHVFFPVTKRYPVLKRYPAHVLRTVR